MYFNRDKASLRLNVLLEARELVGAAMKNPAWIGPQNRVQNPLVQKSVALRVASPVLLVQIVLRSSKKTDLK